MKSIRYFSLFLFILLIYSTVSLYAAQMTDLSQIAKMAKPAVVLIKGLTVDNKEVTGSGFIIDPSGTIITNFHIIQDLQNAGIRLSNGDIYDKISVQAFDERKDIAIIQISGFDLPFLTLGNSNSIQPGEQVILVGNPLGLESSITTGIISGKRQTQDGFSVIQTDAAANPGSSGGPMMNMQGEVIGLLSFKLDNTENLNFAVPINYARGLLQSKNSIPLDHINKNLSQMTNLFNDSSTANRTRWKSTLSGTIREIRVDGNYIYIETILPDRLIKLNNFVLAELKKKDTIYVGVVRSRLSCEYSTGLAGGKKINTCTDESEIEFEFVTPTRIEGWVMDYPKDDKFDCHKCSHKKDKLKISFVWIPE